MSGSVGEIRRVAGPVVTATGLRDARMYELVDVGDARLPGEVIRLEPDAVVIQVYEDPSGLRAGEPVIGTQRLLEVELGPGLLGSIFDGIQRPLPALAAEGDDAFARPFVERGARLEALDRERVWDFEPSAAEGDEVGPGDVLGTVHEGLIPHRVLVPDGVGGRVTAVRPGPARVEDPVAWVDGEPVTLLRRWPVRQALPVARRADADTPLVTGQRAIDMVFPVPRGGAVTVPGGFGTGKTSARAGGRQVVARRRRGLRRLRRARQRADRGARRAPAAVGPAQRRVADRPHDHRSPTRSNMPVAAREASVYTGVTLAEYYRDQGYHVALLADSTSRWGEALREVSGRLEEMPAEEGYPAYLASAARGVLRARGRGGVSRRRRPHRLGDARRRGVAARRRLLGADHAVQPAPRGRLLGARRGARAPAPLPRDRLAPQLHAL